jgi:cytochrome c553
MMIARKLVLSVAFLIAATTVFAQNKKGPELRTVRGTVIDKDEAPVDSGVVYLKNNRTQMCSTCHGFGHGLTSGPAAVQNMNRACMNCHTAIHGSNDPSGPLLHR